MSRAGAGCTVDCADRTQAAARRPRRRLGEIYNLDEGAGAAVRELVDSALLTETEAKVVSAGRTIRDRNSSRPRRCGGCDFKGIRRSEIQA